MEKNKITFKLIFTATKLLAYITILLGFILALKGSNENVVIAFVWSGAGLAGVIGAADRGVAVTNKPKETPTNEL